MVKKQNQPERPFMNLSVEEMAAEVQQRDAQLGRRNCLMVAIFFVLIISGLAVGAWYYGGWMLNTLGAAWQVVLSIWNLQWWEAGAILFEYKFSFFIMGIVVGVVLFLFIVLQIGELLVELVWEWIASFFS